MSTGLGYLWAMTRRCDRAQTKSYMLLIFLELVPDKLEQIEFIPALYLFLFDGKIEAKTCSSAINVSPTMKYDSFSSI
jgi:hypothetical protein